MNNIINLTEWRRPSGQARKPMAVVQNCSARIGVERMRQTPPPAYRVTAVFASGEVSFGLSISNTFADLANRLDCLGERYSGMPVAVYFKPYKTWLPNSALE